MSKTTLENFLQSLVLVYSLLIIIYVVMGFLTLPYNLWIGRIRGFLHDTVEPYLAMWRRVLPSVGGLDFSPLIGIIALQLVLQIVVVIINRA
ncbi:MAG TPA: YggT family protein [Thermoleophilia bacterium]|nr:YggT family protein [Thermoleophilia bacterium]